MDSARWNRLQSLFHAAADLPRDEQSAYLATECDDPGLVSQVLALLDEDAGGESLIDRGVAHAARGVLGGRRAYTHLTEQFGAYRVTRVLGEGGMGVVYLGEREDLGSVAAIKILPDAWLSPARRLRFASEQRTLAQLDHPFIARLFDAGALGDGTPWIVMEYVDGAALNAYCKAQSSTIPERLRLFRDVCSAVQHAHGHLVIHRDLKPSNILVKSDGAVKLLDFGIAKQLESLDDSAEDTHTGLRLMTPAYAAPEQIRGGRIGVHTDVYALGVILYELVAGRLPFDPTGLSSEEIATMIIEREATKPSLAAGEGRAALSRSEWNDLDVLCLKAMHKDPQRRYATVDALSRDVDHFLAGEPLEARPDDAGYRLRKFIRRHRAAVSGVAAALALIVALVAFYTVRLNSARNEALADAARAERIQQFTLSLFHGGDDAVGPADSMRVITLIDRGLAEARGLDAEPAAQADLFLTLGGIYGKLGKLPRADSLIQLSLDRRRRLLGSADPAVAEALVSLGQLRIDEAKFEDAERDIREGLDIERHALPASDPAIVSATAALGRVLQERGVYDKAIPVLEDVVRLRTEQGERPAVVAASVSSLADAHFYAGHYDVSDSLNRQVLATYRAAYGPRHPLVADILINLGATEQERGNYREAEAYDRQALDITRAFYGRDHFKTAGNMTMLGRALEFENRFDEASAILQEALAIRERVYGPIHPNVASTVNELANIAVQQSHYDVAEAYFRRMLAIYHEIYGDHHYLIGLATSNLATAIMGKKDYPAAEQLYREAIRRFTEAQGPDHTNTGIARIKLGRALLRQRRFAEGAAETLTGYQIMAKQASPSIGFLQNARKDLAADYDTLGQPDRGARFRAEFVAESTKIAAKAKK